MPTYTVLVYPAGESLPITFPDIVAADPEAAVTQVGLGWPPKRLVRSTAVIEKQED